MWKSLSLMACLIAVIAQCKSPEQDTSTTTAAEPARQLVRIVYPAEPHFSMAFFYNVAGDIETLYHSMDTARYSYTSDSITIVWTDRAGDVMVSHRLRNDAAGRILSSVVRDRDDNQLTRSSYLYDEDGYLLRQQRINMRSLDTFSLDFAYVAGNLSRVAIARNGEHYDWYYYLYDTGLRNPWHVNIDLLDGEYFTNERLGRHNRNLMHMMYRLNTSGDTTAKRHYRYDTDAAGYVTARYAFDNPGDTETERRYTYSNE